MIKKHYFIILLALIILLAGAGAATGYYFWKILSQEKQSQQQLQLQTQQELQTKISSLETQLAQQQPRIENLQNQLSNLVINQQQNVAQENLNEVAYLLDLANLYLQINQDPASAIRSLQLAQHQIQALADPRLLALQQALASDINQLNDVKHVDTADVLLNLQTLSESIGRLSLIPHPMISPALPASVNQEQKAPWLKNAWHSFWGNFKSLFIIRYQDKAQSSLLPPEQRQWVQENIAFTLAQAQWAVLQKKTDLYQHSLAQVQKGLQDYYPDSSERQKIFNRIAELAAINISPDLPNLDASLRAIKQALQNRAYPEPEKQRGPTPQKISPGIEI